MWNKLLFFTVLMLTTPFITSKVITDGTHFGNWNKRGGAYLTKFGVAPGTAKFQIKLKTDRMVSNNPVQLQILAIPGDNWDKIKDTNKCAERKAAATGIVNLTVPVDGTWSEPAQGGVNQVGTAGVWYFYAADCDAGVSKLNQAGNRIKWEVILYNSDGSHFSEEESGLIFWNFLMMLLTLAFLVLNAKKFHAYYKQEESADYPVMILLFVVACEFFSCCSELIHLFCYKVDGEGIFFFDMSQQALTVLAQFLVTVLLLLMAYGWSIECLDFEDMDIFVPLAVLFGVLHFLVIFLSRLTESENNKYHDYENWAGIVLVVIRMMMFLFWIYLFVNTLKKAKGIKREFYINLGALSVVYLLAYPALLIVSAVGVSPWNRHKFVTIGTLLLQTGTIIGLTYMFTNTKAKYYSISIKGKMVLPTNKNHLF